MGVFHEVCVLLTCRFGALWPALFLGQKPVMDRFQLSSFYSGAYEWEVLAARARSDLGALREPRALRIDRARSALSLLLDSKYEC